MRGAKQLLEITKSWSSLNVISTTIGNSIFYENNDFINEGCAILIKMLNLGKSKFSRRWNSYNVTSRHCGRWIS